MTVEVLQGLMALNIVAVIFGAGVSWAAIHQNTKKVDALDTDLRTHMREEVQWRLEHVEGHP